MPVSLEDLIPRTQSTGPVLRLLRPDEYQRRVELQKAAAEAAKANQEAALSATKASTAVSEASAKQQGTQADELARKVREQSALSRLTGLYSSGQQSEVDPQDVFSANVRFDMVEKDMGNGATGLVPVGRTVYQERKAWLDKKGNEDLRDRYATLPAHESTITELDNLILGRTEEERKHNRAIALAKAQKGSGPQEQFINTMRLANDVSTEIIKVVQGPASKVTISDFNLGKAMGSIPNDLTYDQFIAQNRETPDNLLRLVVPLAAQHNALVRRAYGDDPSKLEGLLLPELKKEQIDTLPADQAGAFLGAILGKTTAAQQQFQADALTQLLQVPAIKLDNNPVKDKPAQPPPQMAGQVSRQKKEVNQDLIPSQRQMESDQDFMDRVVISLAGSGGKLTPDQKKRAVDIFNAKRRGIEGAQ